MGRRIFYFTVFFVTIFFVQYSSAQTVETGHEVKRGQFNFTALADSYALHLPTLGTKELENEDDEEIPARPASTDLSQIHSWSMPTIPGVFTPFSPAPTDSFESTLDNGTSIPPDTHGAVDSNYCMTTLNTDVRIQSRAGGVISTVSLDAFFNSVAPTGGTFDPRCHYDLISHRWIVVADDSGQTDGSSLLIAISKTSNPTGAWWTYKIITYPAGGYWLDYPDVGFNSKWIAISGNLFPNTGSGYAGCKMFVFNKANLLSGAGAPFTAFTQASSSCICPAITYDPAQTSLFCLESWNGSAGAGGQLRMWKITGAVGSESMTTVGYPAYSGFRWQSQSNAISGTAGADFAPQLGSANKIQTNDDRIFQVVFMNNKLWTAHNVFLPYSTTTNATRCSVLWWQTDTLANPVQIGVVDDATNTNFYSFPAIAVNTNDDALLGFSTFSSAIYPSAAYSLHLHTDAVGTMESVYTYRHGTNTYYKIYGGTRDRWGDYSACVIDPLNQIDFWTLQEASASPANTFDTWWAYIKPCNPPGATITPAGPTTFCAGSSVILNANTGTGYSYQWQLGGTDISGATTSSYTATAAGNYTVILTVSSCNSTSAITTVVVNAAPSATITPVGSTALCSGGSVLLNANTGAGLTYQWQLGGSGIGGATNSSYTASSAGNYTVIVTNAAGCSTTSAVTTVTVGTPPPATITPAGPTTFCSGGSVVLNANTGAGLSYQWRIGGASIAGATTSAYTASLAGNYTVIVTNLAGCNATSAITAVVVNPAPPAITGTPVVCAGATTPLSDATPGGTWTTSNPAVATVSGLGVVTGIGTGGIATISYTVSGCVTIIVVTVNSISVAAIAGPSSVCAGQTINLTDATPGGTWSSSNTTVATVGSSTGVVSALTSGSTTISYAVSGSCGTASVTKIITVNAATVVAPITGTLSICTGATSALADATPSGVWSASNPLVSTISIGGLVTAVASGVDTISYTVTNLSGCVSSATAVFTVFNSSSATVTPSGPTSFCTGGNVMLSATTGTGISYQWQRNGVTISGATSSVYTASISGNYTVVLTVSGGCVSTSTAVTVTVNPLPITPPSVAITASAGPVFCVTTSPATFTAVPTNGGSSPTYQWSVNGVAVGTAVSFSYTPVVGDIVKCIMTSNATCAFPLTASRSDTISLSTMVAPSVSIVSAPSVICSGSPITFTGIPVYGGSAPTYNWRRNDTIVATGPSYVYTPHYGDVLKVTLYSNYPCLSVDTAVSPSLTIHPQAPVANTISVTVTQSGIVAGSVDTFIAIAPNGGLTPHFQWLLNGVAIPGATSSIYVTDSLAAGQIISCEETSSLPCAVPPIVFSGGVTVKVIPVGVRQISGNGNNFTLIPNPNKGEFTIEGSLRSAVTEEVGIIISDMLGQVIYNETTTAKGGKLNKQIIMDHAIANGNYLVTIIAGGEQVVYRLVINK